MKNISKYKEVAAFRSFRIISISFLVLVTAVFVLNNSGLISPGGSTSVFGIKVKQDTAKAYRVLLDDYELGFVEEEEDAYLAIATAKAEFMSTNGGQEYLMDTELELIKETVSDDVEFEDIEKAAYQYLLANTAKYEVKAVKIRIDDYEVIVDSMEAAEEVLNYSKAKFDPTASFVINLDSSLYATSLKEASIVKNELVGVDSTLTAAGEDGEPIEQANPITGLEFNNEVVITETYAKPSEITTVEDAVADITVEKEVNKTYKVVKGDTFTSIAKNFDTTIEALQSINPGINVNLLSIGQEIIVSVPEPKLSFITLETVVYDSSYSASTVYVDNPDKYVGYNTTISSGSAGTKQITAIVKKENGKEISRQIIDTVITKEAVPKKVSKGTKPLPQRVATGKYVKPISSGRVTSNFGNRSLGYHSGVDWGVPTGTIVFASDGGTVTKAGWGGTYGKYVEINHGSGIVTRYAHLSSISVKVGQKVAQYEKLGLSGNTGRSTGPHLHFELRFDGVAVNPLKYIK